MKLTALFLTFLSLFFVLISLLPFLIIPSMALCCAFFFLLITLILGLLSKCRFAYLGSIIMLLVCGLSTHLKLIQIQDALNAKCEELILEGNYKVSDYIIKHTQLAYITPNEESTARINQLERSARFAKQAEATAISLGASPAEVLEQIAVSVQQAKTNTHEEGCGCADHEH